uniref:Uncharacterized protein n=1 Tax=Glossina austeni TaxID=7395 RepID=A0A1A9VAZ0_GLOAU
MFSALHAAAKLMDFSSTFRIMIKHHNRHLTFNNTVENYYMQLTVVLTYLMSFTALKMLDERDTICFISSGVTNPFRFTPFTEKLFQLFKEILTFCDDQQQRTQLARICVTRIPIDQITE